MKIYIKSGAEDIFPESNPKTSPDMLRKYARSNRLSDRRMVAYNPSTPSDTLEYLMDTDDDIIKSGIYHNPNVTSKAKERLYQYFKGKGSDTMRAYHIQPAFANRRIKCSTLYPTHPLDEFIGEDVWIRVHIDNDPIFNPRVFGVDTSDVYIKIVDYINSAEPIYMVRWISSDYLDYESPYFDTSYTVSDFNRYTSSVDGVLVKNIDVVEPISVLSTDEIIEMLEDY